MKSKKIGLIILIALLVIIIFLYLLTLSKKEEQKIEPAATISPKNSMTKTDFPIVGKVFRMPTKDGQQIELKNPYENNEKVLSEKVVQIKNDDYFTVLFHNFPDEMSYLITIQNEDIQSARDLAEKDFMEYLEIPKEQLCQIKVYLGVPRSVNEKVSGPNYGLSFCPDGKPFPAGWEQ